MIRITTLAIGAIAAVCAASLPVWAQSSRKLSPEVQRYVRVDAPVVALEHVRLIDGTGGAPKTDQTVVISGGKIQWVGSGTAEVPAEAKVLDLQGYTVIPGLVGMHDHMFYPSGRVPIYNEMTYSFPKLYLAAGVTTIRTTGSLEPYTDLELKKLIDSGEQAGPEMFVTGPYLEGAGAFTPQMHILKNADDAKETVNYWADEGVTSFKAYMHITRAELAAVVETAHKRGLKVTGHLCSIGFREAAAIGIDNLEHGLFVDTEFVPGKAPDVCPSQVETRTVMAGLDLESAPVQAMIHDLVEHHVAITSTLPVFEPMVPNRPPLDQRVLDSLIPEAQVDYLRNRIRSSSNPALIAMGATVFKREMDFERMFVKEGGTLLAGLDPTGGGGIVAGFGDQREVELLVEAGFTPIEALRICSFNGAQFLGEAGRFGTIAPGKAADLAVIHGDPSQNIADIEKVEIVFKDGVGYDSAKLIEAARDSVGLH
ncbi:MAG TPA: amidohydrolase family protein [Candidatus Limnocylindrales bacterium]|nr:amidohydrolase family protein [Candidatus Limnocylindrales bacterium]